MMKKQMHRHPFNGIFFQDNLGKLAPKKKLSQFEHKYIFNTEHVQGQYVFYFFVDIFTFTHENHSNYKIPTNTT